MGDKKLVLGLDLDQVCANYTDEFRHYVARYKIVDPSTLPEPENWAFEESGWGIKNRDEFLKLHGLAVDDGLFRSMPPIEGASETLRKLSKEGVWIRIITHRLIISHQHSTAASDTIAWLDRHRIPYKDICFVAMKPDVNADLYVDDSPIHIQNLRSKGAEVIVFDTLYNQSLTGPRAKNWDEVYQIVKTKLNALDSGE